MGDELRLRVQREDESITEIVMIPPVQVLPPMATLWRMLDAAGVEHFFTEEGYYDGHGGMIVGLDVEEVGVKPQRSTE